MHVVRLVVSLQVVEVVLENFTHLLKCHPWLAELRRNGAKGGPVVLEEAFDSPYITTLTVQCNG
jgi:hypothetical protein